ncbi:MULTISPECIES: EAL domain-containing protein [Microbulbifer]|uniref:EAL domain-containing protein n=1 Tax=Microbulbifer celer TaxID=435905 RepID=A0ABW3U3I8_9GAMM|nr:MULTISPECIES: EAL domain-containing protein [Microbulbifer]UFN58040.1 EAL domain-containing protein [Microbulbifer celer]
MSALARFQSSSQGSHTGAQSALLLMVCTFVLACFCKSTLVDSNDVAAIWFAEAVTIAFLYRSPLSSWPVLLVGAIGGNTLAAAISGLELVFSFLYAAVGAVESLLAACLLLVFCPDTQFFSSMSRWVRFIFLGALVPAVAGAALGAGIAEFFDRAPFTQVFINWYVADVAGICIFLPLMQLVKRESLSALLAWRQYRSLAVAVVITLSTISLILAFLPQPYVFVSLPLIWAASRLELSQALLVIFLAAVWLLWVAVSGHGLLPVDVWPPVRQPDGPLKLLPLYAAIIPGYVVAVSAAIERRRNQRIVEVESSFRAAMESSRIGMLLVSLDNRIVQANESFCHFIGYPSAALRGQSLRDVLSPGDAARLVGERGLIDFEGTQTLDGEWQFRCKGGVLVWGHLSSNLARGSRNEPLYAVVQVEDIDWRKRSARQLAQAEERWKFSLAVTGQGVFDWDVGTGKTFFSEWLSKGVEIDRNSLTSRADWLQKIFEQDRVALEKAQRAHLRGESEAIDCQYRVRTDSGDYRWIHEVARVMEYDGEAPQRIIGILKDITESKQMANSLAEEKEHLQVTLSAITDAVISVDIRQRITFMNPVAEHMTGYRLQDVRGEGIREILDISPGAEGDTLTCPVSGCIESGNAVQSADNTVLHSRTGEAYNVKCSASPLKSAGGQLLGAVLVFQDITETRQLIKQLTYKANHDDLTHLPNRDAFKRELYNAVDSVKGSDGVHALAYIDLDRFKVINDSAGHQAGDALLKNVAKLLRDHLRPSDCVARLGGDEFGLLLKECDKEQARLRCEQLVRKIGALRFPWHNRLFDVGASVGLTEIHRRNNRVVELMSQADVACYSAKHAGRGAVMLYEVDSSEAAAQHREIYMASTIREALEQNRLRLYAQPIAVAGNLAQVSHYEILVRMVDERGNMIMPGAFIPAAERYGLMLLLDRWVAKELLERRSERIAASGLSFALNISADALGDKAFQQELVDSLKESTLPAEHLGIEITETAMINQMESASQFVSDLRSMGCKVALDDFGNGLSSFGYLKQFAIDYVKIDGSFVREVESNFVDLMIVESINQVAHRLRAQTIAEFVEDAATAERLRTIGVDLVQGYYIGRPIALDELLQRNLGRAASVLESVKEIHRQKQEEGRVREAGNDAAEVRLELE